MKWIVVWTVVSMFCSSPDPIPDEFGRIGYQTSLLVCSWKEAGKKKHEKEFTDKEEAVAFFNKLKEEQARGVYQNSVIEGVELHEVTQ